MYEKGPLNQARKLLKSAGPGEKNKGHRDLI